MGDRKSLLGIVFHSIIGFIMLIIFLIIANVLLSSIDNSIYTNVVKFCNSLLGLFIILFLVGLVNNIFWNFEFPLNILAPISGAMLGVAIVDLVSKILLFTQTYVYFSELQDLLSYNIRSIVFFATLIIGYLIIILEVTRERKDYEEKRNFKEIKNRNIKNQQLEEKKKKPYKSEFSWERVGDEFKRVFLNIGKALNRAFDGGNGKDKKIKRIKK